MTGNAKHQAAVEATAERVLELRADIATELQVLVDLADQLEDLADTRQSVGLGFMTEDLRRLADQQARADRAAVRTQPEREIPGTDWMNAAAILGSGQVPAPVTIAAVSASAEISFALQHHIRRLAPAAVRAAAVLVPGGHGRLPAAPSSEGDVAQLVEHLALLVDVYSSRPGLEEILRDLDQLEATAREVVDGPARTRHPEPCPWCGRPSLVIIHREQGRDTQLIRCAGRHACECDYEFCDCHRNPFRNRHEWVNSGRAAHTWNELSNLQNARKELAQMETKALDALERVLAVHQPTAGAWVDTAQVAEINALLDDPHVCNDECEGDAHLVFACGTCADSDGGWQPYPCATVRALDLTPSPNPEEN